MGSIGAGGAGRTRLPTRKSSITGSISIGTKVSPTQLQMPVTIPGTANSSLFYNNQGVLVTPSRNMRSLCGLRNEKDFLFDVRVLLPGTSQYVHLSVHRSMSLTTLRAMIQREFGILFEEQKIRHNGEILEGDHELTNYDIMENSVLQVTIQKRYRRIGDIFNKIKIVKFNSKHPDDYEVLSVVAALPPLPVVFRRLAIAIAYLSILDTMQYQKTSRRIWKQKVTYWDDTNDAMALFKRNKTAGVVEEASYVLNNFNRDRVAYLLNLATTLSINEKLKINCESRTSSDVRAIKKWLSSIKYFADANIPDNVVHEVAKCSVYTSVKAGDFIFRQGDVGDFFYIVISGCISISAYGNGLFTTMTPGSCFGEISLFEPNGLRTANANVNFITPIAELAVVPGDLYRRLINPFKQAVLKTTEQHLFSIPQLRQLPDQVITHIAYAARSISVHPGRLILRHREESNVLVLLAKGEVKVSTPKEALKDLDACPTITAIRAPAVFAQECCLAINCSGSTWDIEAIEHCAIVCLRMDTISIFLSPQPQVIQSLITEYENRIETFRARFYGQERQYESRSLKTPGGLALRKISNTSTLQQKPPGSHIPKKPTKTCSAVQTSPRKKEISCAEAQARFLQKALPYSNILTLPEQIRFVSFEAQRSPKSKTTAKSKALLKGLRKLQAEDVKLVSVIPSQQQLNVQGEEEQFFFGKAPLSAFMPHTPSRFQSSSSWELQSKLEK